MGRFLYNGNARLKLANLNHRLFPYIIIFSFHEESLLPFPWVVNLTTYFSQKYNTKNANWKFTKQ